MRSHGRILISIWRDKDFTSLSVEAQRLYLLLLSQKDINNAGVQPLMVSKWAKGCGSTSPQDIRAALNELQVSRFVCFDDETEEILIRSFIRNDGIIKQPNVLKNALRVATQTESARLRKALADELDSLGRDDASAVASEIHPEGIGNPYETLSEGLKGSGRVSKACGDGDGEGVTYVDNSPSASSVVLPADKPRASKRGTRLPENWMPAQHVIDQMKVEHPGVDLEVEHRKFCDYWIAKSGKDATKMDWNATWRNWIRNARPARGTPQPSKADIWQSTVVDPAQAAADETQRRLA